MKKSIRKGEWQRRQLQNCVVLEVTGDELQNRNRQFWSEQMIEGLLTAVVDREKIEGKT